MKTFYLQNQSGLFLTNDKENRKISVEEQDFSNNQTWFLSDKDGKLFCANGTCLAAQWDLIEIKSNSAADDDDYLKFYFHEVEDGQFYIGQLEDKDKKFEGDDKQRFLTVIDDMAFKGTIEDGLKYAKKASIAEFTWKKVSPQQLTYQWVTFPEEPLGKFWQENAFVAGKAEGHNLYVGRGFTSGGHSDNAGILHVGHISGKDIWEARFLGFHDENKMEIEVFYLQSESGLYLTSSDWNSLTLEKLNHLPTQIWYWSNSYDFEQHCQGPIKNELRCPSGYCLYMQQEDDPESIVYTSEATSDDNRHKFYSREIEDGNILIGKFMEKDAEKEEGTFVGFYSEGRYFKMGKPSKDSDMEFKWKKIPVNQAYKWTAMDEESDIPKDAISIDGQNLFMGRAEVNGIIHPGNASNGSRNFGHICYEAYREKVHCNHCCIGQKCNSITTVTDEKFSVLCAEPETEFEWVEMPDIKHPTKAYFCDYSKFPENAVIAGIIMGYVCYVGRGVIDDQVVPGVFKPKHEDTKFYALHDGKMQELEKFEILVMRKKDEEKLKKNFFNHNLLGKNQHFGVDNGQIVVNAEHDTHNSIDMLCVHPEADVDWVEYEDEKLPLNAVIAGLSDDGIIPTGIYYVGRGVINNDTIPGIFLHKKISRERSGAKEHTLYALYCGELHQLEKFQVLVVKKHVKEKSGAPEKTTTASDGLKEDNWKLIENGDLPAGFEIIDISEKNFSEHAEKIRSLTLKAIEDGTIKIVKKMDGNANTAVSDQSDSEDKEHDEKEIEAVKTAFAKADTEGTGKLTRYQLKVALGELIESGHDVAFISDKKMLDDDDTVTMFIEVADRDGDKLINLNELLIIMDLGDEKLDHKEMFTKLVKAADKDGNGLITVEELRFMVVKAGFESDEDEASEMANMFMSMGDLDGDKKLKIQEVVNLFTDGPPEEDSKERMKRMFKMYDTNEDGFISKKELIEYIKSMGFVDEDDTPEDVTFMVNMLMAGSDEDKDGKLTYDEFCNILG